MTLNSTCQLSLGIFFFGWDFFYFKNLIHWFQSLFQFLSYMKDWPGHGCAEPLRAIQRKRKAGFLQGHKEEKEKIPNGNLSSACQFGMDALVHAYGTVCPSCILDPLLPNFYHICRNMKSFFLCVCPVSCPLAMNHGPLYCRCKSLEEGLLPPRNLFSPCLAQRIA